MSFLLISFFLKKYFKILILIDNETNFYQILLKI